jgi:very-short-patch-repair endonuclease
MSVRGYVCDLYWESAHLAIEYDSGKHHAEKEKMAKDSIRRADLAAVGVTVISVTYPQVKNSTELHKLAHLIAKKLGKQMCYLEPGFTRARLELRSELLR